MARKRRKGPSPRERQRRWLQSHQAQFRQIPAKTKVDRTIEQELAEKSKDLKIPPFARRGSR